MNSLNLVGRVSHETELKEVGKGDKKTMMLRNVLAVVDNYNREKTNFIPFTMFGKTAENFHKVVDKGDLIGLANAEMKADNYENKDGDKRTFYYALTSNWQLYRKKNDNNDKQENNSKSVKEEIAENENDFDENDLPY